VGQKIDLIALGINNGCYERLLLEKIQINYFYANSHYLVINASTHAKYLHILTTNATAPSKNAQIVEAIKNAGLQT
jgi:hypothetical protein